tara:strand:+ start:3317 stop:3682 length:366 start_codon:yes stop_codon:yes gene_type:complete
MVLALLNNETMNKKLYYYISVITVFTIFFYIIGPKTEHWIGVRKQHDNTFWKKIFNRFYYTIICISTIGLGDMKPNTLSLKLFTIFLGILIILELVNILANSDADKSDDMEKAKKTIEKLI